MKPNRDPRNISEETASPQSTLEACALVDPDESTGQAASTLTDVAYLLLSARNRHDAVSMAWALELAFLKADRLRREFLRGYRLGSSEQALCMRGVIEARAGVEMYTLGTDRDEFVEGLQALQSLIVVNGPSPFRISAGEASELWNLMRIAKNVAEIARLKAENQASEKRAVSTLDFPAQS